MIKRCPSGPGISSYNSKEVAALVDKRKLILVRPEVCFINDIQCYWLKMPQMNTVLSQLNCKTEKEICHTQKDMPYQFLCAWNKSIVRKTAKIE